ncbi:MAG TPA: LLM class flavin-dependent oxidoreductase [Candidatus Binatus sp.]|uniref:LLM class flavin-dependent oxidoreductase n=1 Tax=Candidatus Binatus sp. TaxID=2811406 RepID=UPI002B4A8020|nr:LLM class flavin-dependent oxidoreductase [Candidatus Binatus sp.]HKN15177.1 LLM class flavin-dependent oxidoreductase [Candidatus Binatus sp.]
MAKKALACTILPDSPPARLIEWSRAAEDAGFSGVFMTESNNDSLACSLALGLHARRIKLGTAITNIYLRHPNLLAKAAAVQEFTGGRFILGLGTGHREGNSALGIEMGVPLARMRETVKTLRAALDGGKTGPRVSTKLPLYLAGVSRPMVKLAGEIGDGVIFNFFPPARVREALGELAEGAKIAGRDVKQIEATLFATAFISDDLEAARRPARKLLSRYGALKFYGNMMAHSGFEREIGAIRAAGRDADAAIAAVSNELIDATLLVGSEARVRERLQELCAPGIGTAIVFTNPVNEDRNAAVLRTIRALKQ